MELVKAVDCAGTQTWLKLTSGSPVSMSSELSVNTCHRQLCVCCGIYCSWAYDGPSTCDEWWNGSSVTLCQVSSSAESTASRSTGMYRRTEASLSRSFASLLSISDSTSPEGELLPCRRVAARRWRHHRCTITQNPFKLEQWAHCWKFTQQCLQPLKKWRVVDFPFCNHNYLPKTRYKALIPACASDNFCVSTSTRQGLQ